MLRSTGSNYSFVRRFDDTLPGWGSMKQNDQFYVGDFNSDGLNDLYVFNGPDWSMPYLEMLRSTGNNLAFTRRSVHEGCAASIRLALLVRPQLGLEPAAHRVADSALAACSEQPGRRVPATPARLRR